MKFNFSLKGRKPAGTRYTFVQAGIPDVQSELYTALLSASLYAKLDQQDEPLLSIREGIRNSDPEFVAGLAVWLREQKRFSQLAFLLTAELAALRGNDEKTGLLVGRIVRHVADVPVWLDCFHRLGEGGWGGAKSEPGAKSGSARKLGRAVRKSLSTLLGQLDEYQFTRYNRETQAGIKQALLFLRPKAADRDQKELFSRIQRDQVMARPTWEQEWHALHQQHYDSPEQRQVILRDKWKEGLSSFRIGYTALLDNLQPMLCTGVSGKVLKLAAEYLGNAAAVTRAGHSPLKMLEAYRSLRRTDQGGVGMLTEALEQAALHSSWSRSDFGKNAVSVIAMDVSDSMKSPVSGAGSSLRFDIAPLLALSWKNRGDEVITGIVGNTWKPLDLPARPILSATDELRLREGEAGYAINAHLVLQDLLRKRQVVDKVLIFTDTRLWDNRTFNQTAGTNLGDWWREYRRQVAPQAKLYCFDLAGYGSKPLEILDDGVYLVAGWQDATLDVLEAVLHNSKETLENMGGAGNATQKATT
jgi:60 kDa SS-A/Ro ribonucleoprotein